MSRRGGRDTGDVRCDRKNSTKTSGKLRTDWECNSIWSCWQAYQALAHFGNLIYHWCRLNFGSFNQPLSQSRYYISPTKILHYGQQQKNFFVKIFFVREIFWVTPKYLMFVFEWMCMWEILYIHWPLKKRVWIKWFRLRVVSANRFLFTWSRARDGDNLRHWDHNGVSVLKENTVNHWNCLHRYKHTLARINIFTRI